MPPKPGPSRGRGTGARGGAPVNVGHGVVAVPRLLENGVRRENATHAAKRQALSVSPFPVGQGKAPRKDLMGEHPQTARATAQGSPEGKSLRGAWRVEHRWEPDLAQGLAKPSVRDSPNLPVPLYLPQKENFVGRPRACSTKFL